MPNDVETMTYDEAKKLLRKWEDAIESFKSFELESDREIDQAKLDECRARLMSNSNIRAKVFAYEAARLRRLNAIVDKVMTRERIVTLEEESAILKSYINDQLLGL